MHRISFEVSLETLAVGLDASGRASNLWRCFGPKLHSTYMSLLQVIKRITRIVSIASGLGYNPAEDTIFYQISTLDMPQQHHYLLLRELEHLRN